MPRTFSLELSAVEVLAEELKLPRRWTPFDVKHIGTTESERRAYVESVWDDLRSRGLASRGRLDVDVEDALRVLTKPETLIVVRVNQAVDNPTVLYRAASASGVGVLALNVADRIDIELLKADELVGAIVGELPNCGPVPVREASILTDGATPSAARQVADQDDDHPAVFADDLPPEPRAREDRRAVEAFARWPVERFGGYELSVRGADGRLKHLGTTTFTDTHGGRFVVFTEPLPDGTSRRRFVPSDGSHLRRWLHGTIAEAREDARGPRRR